MRKVIILRVCCSLRHQATALFFFCRHCFIEHGRPSLPASVANLSSNFRCQKAFAGEYRNSHFDVRFTPESDVRFGPKQTLQLFNLGFRLFANFCVFRAGAF